MLSRIGSAAGGLLFGALLLVGFEVLLAALGVGDDAPLHDPFAGFSSAVPMFEPATSADGRAIFRISAARKSDRNRLNVAEPQREFERAKAPGEFRVFVVGGSSSEGVPYGVRYAFSGWLERRLASALPEHPIKVVNAALSAYSSRRVLPIVEELGRYEPDLLVVYMGHNEWAESVYYQHLLKMDPRLFRILEWVYRTRSYALASRILDLPVFQQGPELDLALKDNAYQMFGVLRNRAEGEDRPTARARAYRDLLYEHNLRKIIRTAKRAGARVMVLTLSQNFSDWPPAASVHLEEIDDGALGRWQAHVLAGKRFAEQGDCESALARYEAALVIDAHYAMLHYRAAKCHRALGNRGDAWRHYRLASDLDQVPHGASTRFNAVIKEMAEAEGAMLVDVDSVLTAASGEGLVGNDLFADFVHPNIFGHQLIAEAIAEVLRTEGLPERAESWQAGYMDPPVVEIYAALPQLRINELTSRVFVCVLAPREECPAVATRLLELDPGNKVAKMILKSNPAKRGLQQGTPAHTNSRRDPVN